MVVGRGNSEDDEDPTGPVTATHSKKAAPPASFREGAEARWCLRKSLRDGLRRSPAHILVCMGLHTWALVTAPGAVAIVSGCTQGGTGTSNGAAADGGAAPGSPATDPPKAGSVPSGLVGTWSGVTTATADTFVHHRSSGTQVLDKCGSSSSSALGAVDLTYRYALGTYDDGQPKLTIHAVEDDGTVNASGIELHH